MPPVKARLRAAYFLAFLAAAFSAWAQKPWNDKSYESWSEKDVKRILNKSPWSIQVATPAQWTLFGHQGLEVGVTKRIESRPTGPQPSEHATASAEMMPFLFRWASSQTIRAALLRERVLRGAISQTEAAQATDVLAQKPAEFEIRLIVLTHTIRFPDTTEWQIERNTVLRLKATGLELKPTKVRIYRQKGAVEEVAFFFSRKDPLGEPAISGDDGEAELNWSVGGATVVAKFKLAQMRNRAGLDL